MNKVSNELINRGHKAFGDTKYSHESDEKNSTKNSSLCTEYVVTEIFEPETTNKDVETTEESLKSYSSSFTSDFESGIAGEKVNSPVIASVCSVRSQGDPIPNNTVVASKRPSQNTRKNISKPAIAVHNSIQASRLSPFTTNVAPRQNSARNSAASVSSSVSASCLYNESTSITRKDSQDIVSEFEITELAEALRQLSRDARFRNIRPPWRDPNSRSLPSDEAASVEAMLKEYNQLLINASSEQSNSLNGLKVAVRRPYHSTLNRWRQQERIQLENFYIANRLRNIRPSPGISRDLLLKRYRQYFVTPITAQGLKHQPVPVDIEAPKASVSSRSHPRCSSAYEVPQSSRETLRPHTGIPPSGHVFSSRMSHRKHPPAAPLPPRPPFRRPSAVGTPHSREVLDSLDSVKRALNEQRTKGKL